MFGFNAPIQSLFNINLCGQCLCVSCILCFEPVNPMTLVCGDSVIPFAPMFEKSLNLYCAWCGNNVMFIHLEQCHVYSFCFCSFPRDDFPTLQAAYCRQMHGAHVACANTCAQYTSSTITRLEVPHPQPEKHIYTAHAHNTHSNHNILQQPHSIAGQRGHKNTMQLAVAMLR